MMFRLGFLERCLGVGVSCVRGEFRGFWIGGRRVFLKFLYLFVNILVIFLGLVFMSSFLGRSF